MDNNYTTPWANNYWGEQADPSLVIRPTDQSSDPRYPSISQGFQQPNFESQGDDPNACPPYGAAFNGAYQELSQSCQRSDLGAPAVWNESAANSANTNGYSKYARIVYNGTIYISAEDNNTSTPGTDNQWISEGNYLMRLLSRFGFAPTLGTISTYIGSLENLPYDKPGYALADGGVHNGYQTLDLRGMYLKGASSDDEIGQQQGNVNNKSTTSVAGLKDAKTGETAISESMMPSHTHAVNTTSPTDGVGNACFAVKNGSHHQGKASNWGSLVFWGNSSGEAIMPGTYGGKYGHEMDWPQQTLDEEVKPLKLAGGNSDGETDTHSHTLPDMSHTHTVNVQPRSVAVYLVQYVGL